MLRLRKKSFELWFLDSLRISHCLCLMLIFLCSKMMNFMTVNCFTFIIAGISEAHS